jgi:diguanylate cyclase (GGDEF)-like protein
MKVLLKTLFGKGFPVATKNILYLCGAIALSFLMQMVVVAYRIPEHALVSESTTQMSRNGVFMGSCSVPCLFSSGNDERFIPGSYHFMMDISVSEAVLIMDDLILVFPQIAGSSLTVEMNGRVLGVKGDPVSGQSSLWNAVHIFSVPSGLLGRDNRLEVTIAGTYEAGITALPYIIQAEKFKVRGFLLQFFSNYNIWLSIGALLAVSIIIISIGAFGEGSKKEGILLGVAGLCVAVFLTDFAYIERLPFSLVLFKRLVVSLRHFSVALFIVVYLKILSRKFDTLALIFSGIHIACAALILLFPGTVVEIKRLYSLTYLAFLPLQIYLLYLVVRYARQDEALRPIVFGVVVAFLTATRDIIMLVLVKSPGSIMISHYGFVVLTLASAVFIVNDALKHYRALIAERQRATFFREQSLKDGLTSSYNRKILPILIQDLEKPFSIILFDIDDFKAMNDEFGHATGDMILIDVVKVAKNNIRADDCVVRVGGDEFMVVLRSCPLEIACNIAERLISDATKAAIPVVNEGDSPESLAGNLSYSLSIGVAYCGGSGLASEEELLETERLADNRMYMAKDLGKGRWFVP